MKRIGFILILFLLILGCSTAPDIGQNAQIVSPDGKDLFIATTEAAYEAERKAISAGDTQGLTNLMLTGQMFTVPNATSVLIIDRGSYRRKVRITAGKFEGLSGWVPDEFVK